MTDAQALIAPTADQVVGALPGQAPAPVQQAPPVMDDAPDFSVSEDGTFAAADPPMGFADTVGVDSGDLGVTEDGTFVSDLSPQQAMQNAQAAAQQQQYQQAADQVAQQQQFLQQQAAQQAAQQQPAPVQQAPGVAPPPDVLAQQVRLGNGQVVTVGDLVGLGEQDANLRAREQNLALAEQQYQNEVTAGRAILENPATGIQQAIRYAESRGIRVPGVHDVPPADEYYDGYAAEPQQGSDPALVSRLAQLEYELGVQRQRADAEAAVRQLQALDPNVDFAAVAQYAQTHNKADLVDAYKLMTFDAQRHATQAQPPVYQQPGQPGQPVPQPAVYQQPALPQDAADQVALAASQAAAGIAGGQASTRSQTQLQPPSPDNFVDSFMYQYHLAAQQARV